MSQRPSVLEALEAIYRHALRLCDSRRLTEVAVELDAGATRIDVRRPVFAGSELVAGDLLASVPRPRGEIFVIATGKAAVGQAMALAGKLPIARGLAVAPPGTIGETLPGFELLHAAHPIPDRRSEAAGTRALAFAKQIGSDDLLICAVSGGTSAMLTAPASGISLTDKIAVTRLLLRSGAAIDEINAVRKRLSAIKGGRLAAATTAKVLCLGLSDVPGDRLDWIGSAPAWPDETEGIDARTVIERYRLRDALPVPVQRLIAARPEATPEPIWPEDRPRPTGALLAGPSHLRAAASAAARAAGYEPIVDDAQISGPVEGIAKMIADRATERRHGRTCWIWVGEPSVVVPLDATGRGGRSGHLALLVAERLRDGVNAAAAAGAAFLACGSDGIDGDSDAAGAAVDGASWASARVAGHDPANALARFDSATLHAAVGSAIVTGPTGTNFTDLMLLATEA